MPPVTLEANGQTSLLVNGDCVEVMKSLPDASVDAVVCDPPYLISFMAKKWDNADNGAEQQKWHQAWVTEALRVLKPGGHLLAFGGTRTYHRLASAVEDAGFEIRDSVIWCYGSGFPKSLDVSKAIDKSAKAEDDAKKWHGWGTALKPAFEPVVVARRPLIGTVVANVLAHGTGALNIDATRIPFASAADEKESKTKNQHADFGTPPLTGNITYGDYSMVAPKNYNPSARWPANLMLSHSPSCVHVETDGDTDVWACVPGCPIRAMDDQQEKDASTEGVSRYFMRFAPQDAPFIYAPKANKTEKDAGCENLPTQQQDLTREPGLPGSDNPRNRGAKQRFNHHPTVKAVSVMAYLCRLVTPPGGRVLDPFMGSGTTGIAAYREGFDFIGIEREADYMAIAEARIRHAMDAK